MNYFSWCQGWGIFIDKRTREISNFSYPGADGARKGWAKYVPIKNLFSVNALNAKSCYRRALVCGPQVAFPDQYMIDTIRSC